MSDPVKSDILLLLQGKKVSTDTVIPTVEVVNLTSTYIIILCRITCSVSISTDRHHAEVRRAICDDDLCYIADW